MKYLVRNDGGVEQEYATREDLVIAYNQKSVSPSSAARAEAESEWTTVGDILNLYASLKTNACPKCGSTERQRGEILPKGQLFLDIGFRPESASEFSLKKKIVALACPSCGFIELFLADH